MLGRVCFSFALCVMGLGCAGSAPVDVDKPTGDARTDVVLDTFVPPEEDTSAPLEDTFVEPLDTAPQEVATDTKPPPLVCPGSESEPNGSAPSGVSLKAIDDCDGSGSSFSGIIAGGSDVDYWHYTGSDKLGCVVDASASIKTPGVRLCMYVACVAGSTEFKSCKKGTKATDGPFSVGCCADSSGNVEVEHSCTLVGTDDAADVYFRVDASAATTCTPYKVDYHF